MRWTVRVLLLWLLFKWIDCPNWWFNWICNSNDGIHEKVVNLSFVLGPLKVQVQPIAVAICFLLFFQPGWDNKLIVEFLVHLHSILMHQIGFIMFYPCIRTRLAILRLFNGCLSLPCCNSLFRTCSALCMSTVAFGVEKCTRI